MLITYLRASLTKARMLALREGYGVCPPSIICCFWMRCSGNFADYNNQVVTLAVFSQPAGAPCDHSTVKERAHGRARKTDCSVVTC